MGRERGHYRSSFLGKMLGQGRLSVLSSPPMTVVHTNMWKTLVQTEPTWFPSITWATLGTAHRASAICHELTCPHKVPHAPNTLRQYSLKTGPHPLHPPLSPQTSLSVTHTLTYQPAPLRSKDISPPRRGVSHKCACSHAGRGSRPKHDIMHSFNTQSLSKRCQTLK